MCHHISRIRVTSKRFIQFWKLIHGAVRSKSLWLLPSTRWASTFSNMLLYWVGSLILKTPSSSMYPSSLSRRMLTLTYLVTQDEFKLLRVRVRSFPKCDCTCVTRVPVALATKHHCNRAKLKAWPDRSHHSICGVVVNNALQWDMFLRLSNELVATRTLAHIKRRRPRPLGRPLPFKTGSNFASRNVEQNSSFTAYFCGCMPKCHGTQAVCSDSHCRFTTLHGNETAQNV